MNYRTLGLTGLRVSEVGLGCEQIMEQDSQASVEVLNAAIKAGVNYFDLFSPHPSMRDAFGIAMEGRREKFILQAHLWAAIFSILLAVALLMAASELSQALEQGPYTMQLVPEEFSTSKEAYSRDGVAEDMFDGLVMETVPNPNYLSGEKREIVQLFYDINPAGQTTQLARLSEQDILYPLRIILLDAGLSAVFALGGIWIFRRKDIK